MLPGIVASVASCVRFCGSVGSAVCSVLAAAAGMSAAAGTSAVPVRELEN